MAIITPSTSNGSHWYTKAGQPMHEVKRATGDGMRSTTVRDARNFGLLPSVTNILGAIAKPQLERWKIGQAVRAAMESPKQPDESDDYYIRRVIDASKQQVTAAADLGSRIHHALESHYHGGTVPDDLTLYTDKAIKYLDELPYTVTGREKLLVNDQHGYAGTADLLFACAETKTVGVLDFKTRRTDEGKKLTPYDGQGEQLAAYCVAAFGELCLVDCKLINLYISTTEPGRVEAYEHDNPRELWQTFLAAATIWRRQKKYDPRTA